MNNCPRASKIFVWIILQYRKQCIEKLTSITSTINFITQIIKLV